MLNLLSLPEISFGKDFIWGCATSAHQIEGGDVYSINSYTEEQMHVAEPSGMACDFWHRYPQDIETMKSLHLQALRMSVGWGRLEPEEGVFDEKALAVYLDMFTRLKAGGMKIFLTLIHGGEPIWFDKKGHFSKPENVEDFIRFVEWLVPKIASYIDFWMISNETNLLDDPERRKYFLVAQARAAAVIRAYSDSPVSAAHAMQVFVPDDPNSEADCMLSRYWDYWRNGYFFHACRTGEIIQPNSDMLYVPELKKAMDFWGINYYTRAYVSAKDKKVLVGFPLFERLRMIPMPGFYLEGFYPDGLRNGLLGLKDKPVYITENGCCCDDDRWRLLKLAADLTATREAMDRGVDVRGYLHWTFMDNFEWISFIPRFGMLHVDFDTLERTLKPTAKFLSEIITRGGSFDGAMIRKYIPELPQLKLY